MSGRLGKRRANCAASEEEVGSTTGGGGEEEQPQNQKRRDPHHQQQFRFAEAQSGPSYYPPNGGYAAGGFEGGGYPLDGYMVPQQFMPPDQGMYAPMGYCVLPMHQMAVLAEGQQEGAPAMFPSVELQPAQQQMCFRKEGGRSEGGGGSEDKGAEQGQLAVGLPAVVSANVAVQQTQQLNPHHHQLFPSRSPFEPFCTVPGRTSLLSSTTKYKVTIGEIQRRINPPECLNASLIGGILRKAKSKDGGKALRESLKRIGLSLPAGRRKSTCVTAFTALVEEEAVHLANDFHAVLQHDFPHKDVGLFLNSQFLHFSCGQQPSSLDANVLSRRRAILNCARLFLKELTELVDADRSPVCDRRPDLILEPGIQKPLTHFSLITHGFGGVAVLAVLESLNACLAESLKSLDKMFGRVSQQPPASAPFEMGAAQPTAAESDPFAAKRGF